MVKKIKIDGFFTQQNLDFLMDILQSSKDSNVVKLESLRCFGDTINVEFSTKEVEIENKVEESA